MRKTLISLVALAILTACGGVHHHPSDPSTPKAGAMSFTAINSPSTQASVQSPQASVQQVKAQADTVTGSFDFGNIPSTQNYLFEIRNTGSADIQNIQITSDNPGVAMVTPSLIGVLPTEGNGGGVIPLISVQVLHGRGLNGYGVAPTLPQGAFTFTLTASGTDTSGNAIVTTAEVKLNVLVASFTMSKDEANLPQGTSKNNIALTEFTTLEKDSIGPWYVSSILEHLTGLTSTERTRTWSITNTGNVPLTIHPDPYWVTDPMIEDFTVNPGETGICAQAYPAGKEPGSMDENLVWDICSFHIIDSKTVIFSTDMPITAASDGQVYVEVIYHEFPAFIPQ